MIGVNGAFLMAPVTGVQRFAFQLLLGLLEASPDLEIRVYLPPLPASKQPLVEQLREAGATIVASPWWGRSKQVFEQIGLPLMARGDRAACLVHLNNNVSLLRTHPQLCFVYDIATIRLPATYRLAYRIKFRATIAAIKRRQPAVVTLSQFSCSELESIGVQVSAVVPGGMGSPMLLEAEAAEPLTDAPPVWGRFALVLGSADPRKRVEEVVAAWPSVFATLGLKLLVVQGVAPTHRAAETSDSEHEGIVRLSGRISDAELTRLIRQAQLVVFASQYEGGALAAEEVLALGTPVVAADIPTFRELLAPPVAFFGDFAELGERCTHVLAAARPQGQTLEQTRESWRAAGAALGVAISKVSA